MWALGADRPGIVAAVTGVLYRLGCNLKDCSMTVLSRHFAMMMLVEGPDDLSAQALEQALAEAEANFDLTVAVRPLGEGAMIFGWLIGGERETDPATRGGQIVGDFAGLAIWGMLLPHERHRLAVHMR